ncbi:zinc finger protein 99-like isoform X2 [Maniola jurtina]|uniref:zinc finger protein 99-like isoform X2 n=1 Tax=Maniola jurtina TaxID=191418 RepID=UPI001E68878C|nr:zinc finger protein 99-like isoform X2 [Maniola jurtina]
MEGVLSDGMCRCCATEGSFKDFQVPYQWMGVEEIYGNMLKDCFDITLSVSEDINNGGICEVCITQLRNACNFKQQVQRTEEQFQKKMQESSFKPGGIKMEISRFEDEDSNLSADDFSSQEYEVPIKVEKVEEKPKKRAAAKASTSKAKKTKVSEGEPSVKRGKSNLKVEVVVKQEPVSDNDEVLVTIEYDPKNQEPVKAESKIPTNVMAHGSNQARVKPVPIIKKRYMSDKTTKSDGAAELVKHLKNIRTIMLHSTATPIRHYDGAGYVCMLCPKLYPTVPDLKEHVLEEHDEIDKSSCMEGYTSRNFLVKLDITNLYCLICYNKIDSLENLMDHLATEHKKVIHTDIPNHILPFKFADNKFNCLYCPKVFEHFKHVQEHMNIHYTNYVCDICNSTYVNKQLLNRHALKHRTGEFKCSQCPKIYSTNRKRLDHEKFIHNEGLGKRNKCAHCDARFASYAKKRSHMVEEHGVEPLSIKCEYCNRTFNTRARWYNHKKRHHAELKHPCIHCELKFPTKVDLERHMETHASIKEYKCDVCHKAYSRKYTLRNHMNIHDNVRHYKCEYCSSSFVQKWTWKVHMKNIHKIIVT